MITPTDKQSLARSITSARSTDLAIAHIQAIPATAMTTKDALEQIRAFVSKRGDYTIMAIRK